MSENQEVVHPENDLAENDMAENDMTVPTTGSEESGDTLEEEPAPQEVPD